MFFFMNPAFLEVSLNGLLNLEALKPKPLNFNAFKASSTASDSILLGRLGIFGISEHIERAGGATGTLLLAEDSSTIWPRKAMKHARNILRHPPGSSSRQYSLERILATLSNPKSYKLFTLAHAKPPKPCQAYILHLLSPKP